MLWLLLVTTVDERVDGIVGEAQGAVASDVGCQIDVAKFLVISFLRANGVVDQAVEDFQHRYA